MNKIFTSFLSLSLALSLNVQSWQGSILPATGGLYEMAFSNPQNGIVLGENQTLLRTSDGGTNWSSLTTPLSGAPAISFVGLTRQGNNVWVATDNGLILKSTNNGGLWDVTTTPPPMSVTLYDIDFDPSGIYGVAGGNVIYVSDDSGINWTTIPGPNAIPVGKVQIVGNDSIFVTQAQTLYFTTDNGVTWTQSPSSFIGSIGCLESYSYETHLVGIQTSGTNHVYTSTNPYTFFPYTNGLSGPILAIDSYDQGTNILACGANGQAYFSSNGGGIFTSLMVDDPIYLQDVKYFDQNTAYMIGSDNNFYKLVNNSGTNAITENNQSTYQIYPNPSENFIQILGDNFDYVKIHDAMGKLIFEQDKYAGEPISIENLDTGIYSIQFEINFTKFTRRMIKH